MKINERKLGVILAYIGQAIKIAINLLYTPIMLRLLGQSEYGLYQLVYSVVSYLGLLSMGFGSSYLRFYSRYRANDKQEEIARLNGMFMIIFLSISFICILCGYVMILDIHAIFGSGLSTSEYATAKILMILMVFNLALTFPNSVFNCIITSHEKFVFQKGILILESLCSPFLTLPLLILGYGSIGMVSVTTFLSLVILLSNMMFCIKKIKVKFIFRNFKISLLKEMWIFTFFIFLNQIVDQINWSVDKFLLGRMIGTTAVAIYGIGGQINSMYLQFSTTISSVFSPKVNQIVAESNDNDALTSLFVRVGRIQFIVIMLILTGFIFLGYPFVLMWAGNEYAQSYIVTLFLIIPVTIPLIQNLGIEIQRAKNKHKVRSVVYLFITLGNIFISIPLIKVLGPVGAACGTAIALIIGNIIFMNWYYQTRIGLDMFYFWKEIMKLLPALIIPSILGVCIMKLVIISSFLKLIVVVIIYTVVYLCSIYFLGINNDEKKMVLEPIRKVFRK